MRSHIVSAVIFLTFSASCEGVVEQTEWERMLTLCDQAPVVSSLAAKSDASGIARWEKRRSASSTCFRGLDTEERPLYLHVQEGTLDATGLLETRVTPTAHFAVSIRVNRGKASTFEVGSAVAVAPFHQRLMEDLALRQPGSDVQTSSRALYDDGSGGNTSSGPCQQAIWSAVLAAAGATTACVPQAKALGALVTLAQLVNTAVTSASGVEALQTYLLTLIQEVISQFGPGGCYLALVQLSAALPPVGVCLMTSAPACPNCQSGGGGSSSGPTSGSGGGQWRCVSCTCTSEAISFEGSACGTTTQEIVNDCSSKC